MNGSTSWLPPPAPTGDAIDTLSFDTGLTEMTGTHGSGASWGMQLVRLAGGSVRVSWRLRTAGGKRLNDSAPDQFAAARAIHMGLGIPIAQREQDHLQALLAVLGASSPGEAVFVIEQLRGEREHLARDNAELRAENALLRAERV